MSSGSIGVMWNAIGLLLVGGILAGFTGHFWGQGWIWAAIVLLIAITVAMYAVATPWVKRLRTVAGAMAEGSRAVSPEQFEDILRSKRPYSITAIGVVGLLAILYLMIFKPTLGFGGVPECPSGSDTVTVCAFDDQAFDRPSLTVPGGTRFDLVFDNEDDGVPHNVAIYVDSSAEESLFVGETITGPRSATYDVPALDPGEYFFRCDVHPQMNGTLEAA
jgi:plastocyanin